jgi:magnesium-transporting ATPase (P-type)
MNYANVGLRTMVFAQLRFSVADYKKFQVILRLIRTTPNEELVQLFDKFEQGLEFVGITAVNDELQ